MARMAYSLAVPSEAIENGLSIVLELVKADGLPSLSEIRAPRGFLPPEIAPQAARASRPFAGFPGGVVAPRGFLPEM